MEIREALSLLANRFGDLDLADEAVQDALVAAAAWTTIPANPAGWLYTVAHNKAVDRLRRVAVERRRLHDAAPDLVRDTHPDDDWAEEDAMIREYSEVGDEHLRLLLLCCHPALDRNAQVALTLRLAGGLTTAEIAAAFLMSEVSLAQRVVRAKRKIRDAGIPLTIPAALDERIDVVLTVLYLIFNEGYLSRSDGAPMRVDLVDEAIRLTMQVDRLLPGTAEVEGLLALELFLHARTASRFAGGELVLLDDQDRSGWDPALINQANTLLATALGRMTPGPFQVQAIIAAHHANARTAAETDWAAIVAAYAQLESMTASPVVALNHAVAVAMAYGPMPGLDLLNGIVGLDDYHLYWACRAELLHRAGNHEDARAGSSRGPQSCRKASHRPANPGDDRAVSTFCRCAGRIVQPLEHGSRGDTHAHNSRARTRLAVLPLVGPGRPARQHLRQPRRTVVEHRRLVGAQR